MEQVGVIIVKWLLDPNITDSVILRLIKELILTIHLLSDDLQSYSAFDMGLRGFPNANGANIPYINGKKVSIKLLMVFTEKWVNKLWQASYAKNFFLEENAVILNLPCPAELVILVKINHIRFQNHEKKLLTASLCASRIPRRSSAATWKNVGLHLLVVTINFHVIIS